MSTITFKESFKFMTGNSQSQRWVTEDVLDLSHNKVMSEKIDPEDVYTLDLSDNDTITGEELVAKFPEIVALILHNNVVIKGEHLRKIPKLSYLDLSNNDTITDEDLLSLPNLTLLILSHNEVITDNGLSNFTILMLDLSHNKKITGRFNSNLQIQALNLAHNDMITDDVLLNLRKDIGSLWFNRLCFLGLDYNNTITGKAFEFTKEKLSIGGGLCSLSLVGNPNIHDNTLAKCINLQWLILAHNRVITNAGLKFVKKLKLLDLSYNEVITDDGLTLGLSSNVSVPISRNDLMQLNLTGNKKITNHGLRHTLHLKSLILENNNQINEPQRVKDLFKLRYSNLLAANINHRNLRNASIEDIIEKCLPEMTFAINEDRALIPKSEIPSLVESQTRQLLLKWK